MAGRATRLYPLPFSKELYPVGFRTVGATVRPKVVCHYLLDQMHLAAVPRAYVVLRPGKWDIPGYLGDGRAFGDVDLGYLMAMLPDGLPFSLDAATPFVQGCVVAMGFPDILLGQPDALRQVVSHQRGTGADVVLGLFPWDDPLTDDMVAVNPDGRVTGYFMRQPVHDLHYTWALLAWAPRFTGFLHDYVAGWQPLPDGGELVMGSVLTAALAAGLVLESVTFPGASMLDIGTPEGLAGVSDFLSGLPKITGTRGAE